MIVFFVYCVFHSLFYGSLFLFFIVAKVRIKSDNQTFFGRKVVPYNVDVMKNPTSDSNETGIIPLLGFRRNNAE